MGGDSPYREPERPAQLVTDDRVGAQIDATVAAEHARRIREETRRRRLARAARIAIYSALPLGAAVALGLYALEHEAAAGLTIFGMLGAICIAGLVHLIAEIPPRS